MKTINCQKGQLLIEVLVALGVLVIGIASTGFFVIDSDTSSRQGAERNKATLLAREGLEAVISIKNDDFDNLIDGDHGILISNNKWIFSGTSDTEDGFTRTITITDIDENTKKIESEVSWQFTEARANSVRLFSYLTNWEQTKGEGGSVNVDISGVFLANENKEIRGILLENIGETSVIIDKMTIFWTGGGQLQEIAIASTSVWSGLASSGQELDIVDSTLLPSGEYPLDYLLFEGDISGNTLLITFIMQDESQKSVSYIQP